MSATSVITIPELEKFYDHLALAIDAVEPGKAQIFLVKLALLLAREAVSKEALPALIDDAARDL